MRLPSRGTTFWILMVASALSAFLLPMWWTQWGRGLFQPIALIQMPATAATRQVQNAARKTTTRRISADEARQLRAENEALRRQVGATRELLRQTEARLEDLTGLRGQLPDDHVEIIVAPVVGYDASPRRETLLIAKGRQRQWSRAVATAQWVLAVSAPRPEWDEDATLRDLLHREWIVGRVTEVQTRTARVQLATDPAFTTEVRLARVLADGTWLYAEERCLLRGTGGGSMIITQATANYHENDYRMVVVPASPELPTPFSIGCVVSARQRRDSPQHYDLAVKPWSPVGQLTHVYVVTTPDGI